MQGIDFDARYNELGEAKVREMLTLGIITGRGLLPAQEWLRKREVEREEAERTSAVRGVIGTYHHISEAHLARYCAEFDFRYNTRKISDAERTAEAVKGARGKRLMYRQPRSIAA